MAGNAHEVISAKTCTKHFTCKRVESRQQPHDVGTVIIPVLELMKVRLREIK